jgi:hypothetical protein
MLNLPVDRHDDCRISLIVSILDENVDKNEDFKLFLHVALEKQK